MCDHSPKSITHNSHCSFYIISNNIRHLQSKTFAKSCFSIPHYHSPFFSDSFLFWYLTVVAPVHYFLTEKMHVSPSNFKGPWPPKPRLRVRPELRYNHIYFVLKRLSAGNDFPLSLSRLQPPKVNRRLRGLYGKPPKSSPNPRPLCN